MHITHLLKQPPVLLRSLAGLTTLPGVEARARDLEVRAYHLDGPGLPVCRFAAMKAKTTLLARRQTG
jgi:hypothetical protein